MPQTLTEKVSPVRFFDIFKLFVVFLAVQMGATLVMPVWFYDIVRPYFLFFAVATSILLAYIVYMRTQHLELSYDDTGFSLKRGKIAETHGWKEFHKVLLVRTDGDFLVRLLDGERVDLPVSKLKLDPFSFRMKTLGFVEQSRKVSS